MYPVSEAYKKAMKEPVQQFKLSGTIGSVPFTEENIIRGTFEIQNQCSDNTSVQIGQVYTAELSCTFREIPVISRYSYLGQIISPTFYLKLADGTYEGVPLGKFVINEANWSASGISVTAYDFMSKFDKTCAVTNANGTTYQLALMACSNCGLALGTTQAEFLALPNGTHQFGLYGENDIETWRDFISWVAQTCGCNVFADREGNIVFRPYGRTAIDTLDTSHRFSGGSFSDFETRYTGIYCTDIEDGKTEYYSVVPDDGLTYNLGANPFLQYGVESTKENIRREVLTALLQVKYVPFKLSSIGNPAYDLMDVFSFPGGLGDSGKLFCMTKYVFSYGKQYEMQGVGENPAMASARSKTDKEIAGLLIKTGEDSIQYVVYNNTEAFHLSDGQSAIVMDIEFATAKTTHVEINMEFLLNISTTESSDGDSFTDGDAVLTATYFLNGEEVTTYHPVETYQDGRHILKLRYDILSAEKAMHEWEVYFSIEGGSVSIAPYEMYGVIMGCGVAGEGTWDGTIKVSDDVPHEELVEMLLREIMDTVRATLHLPKTGQKEDLITPYRAESFRRPISDAAGVTDPCMVCTPYVNKGLVETDCEVGENGWIGAGTIATGTALSVESLFALRNVTKIESSSLGASILLSFDGRETWVGWEGSEWAENAYMTQMELSEVPASEYSGKEVYFRYVLEEGDYLYSVDAFGASVYVPVRPVTGSLPYPYQEVEYIHAAGDQYIDTGYRFTSSDSEVKLKFSVDSISGQQVLCGSEQSSNRWNFIPRVTSAGIHTFHGSLREWQNVLIPAGTDHVIDMAQDGTTFTRTLDGTAVSAETQFVTNDKTYAIFRDNTVGSGYNQQAHMKLYWLEMYEDGVMVRKLIPCYDVTYDPLNPDIPNNRIGLYDTVHGRFYGNIGTGSFEKGRDIE